jgi:hypothetical protein
MRKDILWGQADGLCAVSRALMSKPLLALTHFALPHHSNMAGWHIPAYGADPGKVKKKMEKDCSFDWRD